MTTFFFIIGWYCIIVGILQGMALLLVTKMLTDAEKQRRMYIWISHPLMFFVGMWALKG